MGYSYYDFFFPHSRTRLSPPVQREGLNTPNSKEPLPFNELSATRYFGVKPNPVAQPNYQVADQCRRLTAE